MTLGTHPGSVLVLGANGRLGRAATLAFADAGWLTVNDGQATIYLNRARRHFWNRPYPGRWVAAATLLVVGAASLMAIQGWLMAPLPPSLVGAMLLVAVVFLFIADQLKFGLMRLAARRPGAGRGVNHAGGS